MVAQAFVFRLAAKLKYHGLKPVVSGRWDFTVGSCDVEIPPAEAGGVPPDSDGIVCSYEVEIPPAEAGGVQPAAH